MAAETPGLAPAWSSGGIGSLEVRWIFPDQLGTALAGWFGRFPARTEAREDAYLLDPPLPGLSVNLRGGRALEVKAYRASPGVLEVAAARPRAHGVVAEVVVSRWRAQPGAAVPGPAGGR